MNKTLATIALSLTLVACSSGDEVEVSEPEVVVDAPVEAEENIVEQLPMPPALEGAIEAYTPTQMEYYNNYPTILGAYALWNEKIGTSWNELNLVEKTSYGKVMKDAVSEYGKRLCVTGNIIEISADRSMNETLYSVGIMNDDFKVHRATAIESSGDLVAGSDATLCGIVIGKFSYDNAAGGTTSAPYLFGMFDLPENK